MEAKVTIAQPFPVLWSRPDRAEDYDLLKWIRDNVKSKHEVIILGQNARRLVVGSESTQTDTFKPEDCLFLFECPRDALLFKLTWGGR